MVPGFKALKKLYKEGKLVEEMRVKYLKDIWEQERIDKLKNFKLSDGSVVDLINIKRDFTEKDELFLVKLRTFAEKAHKIPLKKIDKERPK